MNLERIILDGTKYDGLRENPYTFSASMSGNTLLQNYLIIVHGSIESTRIGDNTLGSVFHKGMEEIVKEHASKDTSDLKFSIEEKTSKTLSNGWVISGTTDLITYKNVIDSNEIVIYSIHDYKLVKQYAVKKILEDRNGHHYAKQLHINRWLRNEAVAANLYIETFAKDANALLMEPTYQQIEISIEPMNDTQIYLEGVTNELQEWIESGQIPDKCDDVWLRRMSKTNATVIPSRCMFYCGHGKAGLCPHYKPDQASRNTASIVSNW